MKSFFVTLSAFCAVVAASVALLGFFASREAEAASKKSMVLNGAGASFPAPVYQNWTNSYSHRSGVVKVNYQSIGSGAGVNQLRENTVDFAGTDNPLTAQQQEEAGLEQFPMVTGGVVVIYNLPSLKGTTLKLSRQALAEMYLGRITKWNDAKIAACNPGVALPDTPVTVVRRADSSGTSFLFTDYLAKCSLEWKEQVGAGSSVKWPVGIGGQKNPGVCNNVAKIVGAIGYTEYTYAVEAHLSMASLENKAGNYVEASPANFAASSANVDWKNADGFYVVLTDGEGEESWPITGVTYILVRKDLAPEKRAALKEYFQWCFTEGTAAAARLNYVPLGQPVYEEIFSKVLK